MERNEFKYFAFISYNSKDMEWGKKVQRKLEHYRMPATLCNEHGWSRTPIKPVFFAPTDIQPGRLTEELQERLRASRNLIVICSPNSAQSEWVGKEIEFFHQLGRMKQIHFFIVDGTPHSGNPDTECFNPIVDTLGLPEILGANIHEKIYRWPWMNKERAYVQLVSKLLGVEFDAIWQRHKRLLIQNIIAWIVGIVVVVVALVGVWLNSQPVDVQVSLNEVSIHNDSLPPIEKAIITLTLDNETKTDTIRSLDGSTMFKNIPRHHIGKSVYIAVKSYDTLGFQSFMPIDTTITLKKAISLDLRRNPKTYGQVHLQFWNQQTETFVEGIEVSVDGQLAITDEKGFVAFFVPLERQRKVYSVQSSLAVQDSIISPWTEGTSFPTLIIKD